MEEKKNNKKRRINKDLLILAFASVNVTLWYVALEMKGHFSPLKFLENLLFAGGAIFLLSVVGAAVGEAVCEKEKRSEKIKYVAIWLGVTAAILYAILH